MITQQIFQGFFDTDGTIQVTLKKTNKTKQQFYKFKQACYMLKCNFLYKEKEAKMFLNIVYSMSENSKRKYSKEQFEKWIVQKLKSRRALKPNFKLYKKLINLQNRNILIEAQKQNEASLSKGKQPTSPAKAPK